MARISNITIDGRVLSRLVIDGREVKIATEPVTTDCLCFTAQAPNSTVKMVAQGSAPVVNLQTSRDGRSWTPYVMGTDILLQNVDDIVYWRAVGSNSVMGGNGSSNRFVMTGTIAASGNVNSLLEENEETARTMSLEGRYYCYSELFYDCSSLTEAPELPATTLENFCYYNMFQYCRSLTSAPVLPATTLANYCYSYMFSGCTSLTSAPVLPVTTLANYCYNGMFSGCTSLTTAPELPATTLANYCYTSMFSGCTSLTTAPELPATALYFSCYSYMFNGCTSLTSAPVLPATTLASGCYFYMFSNCTSLVEAPTLPATNLVGNCYSSMFKGCTNLNHIKVGFTNWMIAATIAWLPDNVGTFECTQELIDNTTSRTTSTVPANWTMVAV